jgi:hypothetical protein
VEGGDVADGVGQQRGLGVGAPRVRRRHQARGQWPAVPPVHVRPRRKCPQRRPAEECLGSLGALRACPCCSDWGL